MSSSLFRPEPMRRCAFTPVDRSTPAASAAARVNGGEVMMVVDAYATGQRIQEQLRSLLSPPSPAAGHEARRAFKLRYREASRRLLVSITRHRLDLTEAPKIGFVKELYPELPDFVLPFAEVQNLNSAWNWYRKGVHLAVLGHRVYPFYGTYVPDRVAHLELFGTWLSQYKGSRMRAVDVGTGCGVLALMLCRAGFESVLATDCSPNAIESVRRELRRLSSPAPMDLYCGDLLGDDHTPADLVVFNPPWMRGPVEGPLDRALYFEDGLFERFFEAASSRLAPRGRVVLVFSNLIQLVQPDLPHPIEAELERGRFELVGKLNRKVRPSDKGKGRGRKTRERVEVWELAKV